MARIKIKPLTSQKIQQLGRKLHQQIAELNTIAESNMTRARLMLAKGQVSAEDFDAFQMRLEESRDQQIEVLRDEHRATLRQDMLVETFWKVAKVPMTETGCETIDREVKSTLGWPWSDAQIAEAGAKAKAQQEMDERVEQLLGSV